MICANCGNHSHHIRVTAQGESCHVCGGFAEAGGARADNALQRDAFRTRTQQHAFEADMLPPHHYNKDTKKVEPNPEFIKHHPDTARYNYSPDELKKAGMQKLAKTVEDGLKVVAVKDPEVKFSGSKKKAIERIVNAPKN